MNIVFGPRFKKRFKKLPKKLKVVFQKRLRQFSADPFDPQLNNHLLHGEYDGARSINVTGDIRAIYEIVDENIAYFIAIGSHSELYF